MRLLKSFIVLFVSSFLLLACSSDDGGDDTNQNDLVIGSYTLTAITINPPQDINEDGTASSNLLDELTCITGTLTVNADQSWSLDMVRLNVTSITGELFFIDCGDSVSSGGIWSFSNNQLSLTSSFESIIYGLNGNTLTRQIGEDLPSFQNMAFTKI